MTIYGRGYRPLQYQPTSRWARLWSVTQEELRTLFRRRLGVLAFLVCLGPTIGNFGILMVRSGIWRLGIDQARMPAVPRMDPESIDFYLTPIVGEPYSYVVFLVITTLVSCRAVAKDRETEALEIYWTRGISPLGYFSAKWFGSFLLLGSLFVAGPAVLWLTGTLIAPDWGMLQRTIAWLPRVLVALTCFTAVLTYLAVAFSGMARTANLASLLWFGLILGTLALGRVLAHVFSGEWWFKAIDPWDAMKRIAEWICGYQPLRDYSTGYAVAFVGATAALVTAVLWRRLRLAEAVG